MDIVKRCHLAAMAAVVSVAPGRSPAERRDLGSTADGAERAWYRIRC